MKKNQSTLWLFLLAVFMLMMCSCGSKADDSEEEKDPNEKYYGTWILVAFEEDGKMYTKDDPGDVDVEVFSRGYKLEKNGKAIYITPTKSEGEYDVEPWIVDGDTILIGICKFEFKDNQLVGFNEYNDNKTYYEKEDQTESKIPNEENTTTTTTTITTTTTAVDELALSEEAFNSKYGSLPSWKEVKYDPTSYYRENFIFKNATISLDDYYNYDYRDTERTYFCIQVQPSEEYDNWYIYASRDEFNGLYNLLLEEDSTIVSIVANVNYSDDAKHNQGMLTDYMYSDLIEVNY